VAVLRMCAHSSGVKKATEPKQIVTVAGFEKRFFFCFLHTAYGRFAAMAYIQILFPAS
jgi:hypothetical protein